MKTFLAVYTGHADQMAKWNALSEDERRSRMQKGMAAWQAWAERHKDAIKDQGGPLGKTKRVSAEGIAEYKNALCCYTIVTAESHEAAARIFLDHPHFTIFPGDGIEVLECLPIPEAAKI